MASTPPLPNGARRRWRWSALAIGVMSLAAMGWMVFHFAPQSGALPPCAFHKLTGWYCPGCGMTRAAHALLHGRCAEAFGYNPLVVPLLPIIAAYIVWSCLHWAGIMHRQPPGVSARFGWTMVAVVFIFWFARNLPWWPCTLLAP
jgi:hypothetical protein